MRNERDKIKEYKTRRDARLAKRGMRNSHSSRKDGVDAFYDRRNERLAARNLPEINRRNCKNVDMKGNVCYNISAGRGRFDADQINGEDVQWRTTKNGKHFALNEAGDVVAGPKAMTGKNISEVKEEAKEKAKAEKSSEKTGAEESSGGKTERTLPKDTTKWNASHTTASGIPMPMIKPGARWNQSTLERIEREAAEAGLSEQFNETIRGLTEDDIVYQTESDGNITACIPGLATRYDKIVEGRSEECQSIYDARREDGEQITTDMLDIARSLNSSLDGVENNFKGGKSTSRKIDTKREKDRNAGNPELTDEEYVEGMDDITRFTMVSSYDGMVSGTIGVMDSLESKGYEIVELDNKWTNPKYKTYKGIHIKARSREGQSFEVQIHSREDLSVKEINHPDYEIERNTKKSPEERAAATERMIERYSALPMPDGIETLESFKKE